MRSRAMRLIGAVPLLLGAATFGDLPREAFAQSREGFVPSRDGVELYYRIAGSGGDTLVVVHGGPGLDQGYLAPDLEYLGEAFTLIFYDQRGAGRSTLISDSAHIHLDAHVADLEHLRRYFDIERIKLLGHSWGAAPAAWYAAAHPAQVAAVILAGALPPRYVPHWAEFARERKVWQDSATQAHIQELSAAWDTAADWRPICRELFTFNVRGLLHDPHDTATIRRMRGDRCSGSAEAIQNGRAVNRLTWQSIGEWDWRDAFGDIEAPVLVIHGAGDPMPLASAHEWAHAFPDSRLVVFEGVGHYPHLERPQEFLRTLQEFLQ